MTRPPSPSGASPTSPDARRVVRCAEREARELGSPTVEAEHLLLALTWTDEAAMAAAGLGRESIVAALESEREQA